MTRFRILLDFDYVFIFLASLRVSREKLREEAALKRSSEIGNREIIPARSIDVEFTEICRSKESLSLVEESVVDGSRWI